MRAHHTCRRFHSIDRYVVVSQIDIVFDVPGKKKNILQNDGSLFPKALGIDIADIDSVYEDLAALNLIKSAQKADNRCLSCTRVPDKSDGLPGFDLKGNVLQNPLWRIIAVCRSIVREPHIAEFDLSANDLPAHRVRP